MHKSGSVSNLQLFLQKIHPGHIQKGFKKLHKILATSSICAHTALVCISSSPKCIFTCSKIRVFLSSCTQLEISQSTGPPSATRSIRPAPPQPSPLRCTNLNFLKHTPVTKTSQIAAKCWEQENETTLPPECGGGPHSSTMPWPWRTDTVLLVLVLKFSRSAKREELN